MKKHFITCLVFTIIHLGVSGQQNVLEYSINDKTPLDVQNPTPSNLAERDIWDLQFTFPIEDTTQGIETDGLYIYISNWRDSTFKKYDFQGNLVEYFRIPGVGKIKDLAYDGQYFYGGNGVDSTLFILDFNSRALIDTVPLSFPARGIAYNPDENVFYSNNWDHSYIYEFDLTGNIFDSIQATEYGWTYGYAYDGWSAGGPYLWGFSQHNNQKEAIITQYDLLIKEPTGFYLDLAYLVSDTVNIFAGGLFTHQDIVSGTITLGGLIQNDLVFGFELDTVSCPSPIYLRGGLSGSDVTLGWSSPAGQQLSINGYNIYRNDTLLNIIPQADTVYDDLAPPVGTHSYFVTALHFDDLGNPGCESNPSSTIEITVEPATNTLGGNVIAGQDKMYFGQVNAFLYTEQGVTTQYTSDIIDTLGYYFFLPYAQNDYYLHASPRELSEFANTYVPTYYGDKYHWKDASKIFLDGDIFNADIDMIPLIDIEAGIGSLQGKIVYENLFQQYSSATDVLVLLMNASSECIAYQLTGQNGNFNFSNLSSGTYTILIEVVGKEMSPAAFNLNSDVTSINDIYFVISETEIIMGLDEILPHYVTFVSELYPNPAKNKFQFDISSAKPAQISTQLFDAQSRLILSMQKQINTGSNHISISTENLPAGVYYVQIRFENGQSLNRKIIILE